jgi:hypothetical protein
MHRLWVEGARNATKHKNCLQRGIKTVSLI